MNTLTPSYKWNLIAPSGEEFRFQNLKSFIREHSSLFEEKDVRWTRRGYQSWCRAYSSITRLRPDCRRAGLQEWKGWRWDNTLRDQNGQNGHCSPGPKFRIRMNPLQKLPDGLAWSVKEVAAMFHIPVSTLYYLAKLEKLPVLRIGGRLRFLKSDILPILGWNPRALSPDAAPPAAEPITADSAASAALDRISNHIAELTRELDRLRKRSLECADSNSHQAHYDNK